MRNLTSFILILFVLSVVWSCESSGSPEEEHTGGEALQHSYLGSYPIVKEDLDKGLLVQYDCDMEEPRALHFYSKGLHSEIFTVTVETGKEDLEYEYYGFTEIGDTLVLWDYDVEDSILFYPLSEEVYRLKIDGKPGVLVINEESLKDYSIDSCKSGSF